MHPPQATPNRVSFHKFSLTHHYRVLDSQSIPEHSQMDQEGTNASLCPAFLPASNFQRYFETSSTETLFCQTKSLVVNDIMISHLSSQQVLVFRVGLFNVGDTHRGISGAAVYPGASQLITGELMTSSRVIVKPSATCSVFNSSLTQIPAVTFR